MKAMTTLKKRADIEAQHTWNLESVFPTADAWEAEYQQLEAEIPSIRQYEGRLGESAGTLLAFLQASLTLQSRLQRLNVYNLQASADQTDQVAKARQGRTYGLFGRWSAAVAFADPELLTLGEDALSSFMRDEPQLQAFETHFRRLHERRPHVRSAEVEAVFGRLAEVFSGPYQTYGSLTNADMAFPKVKSEDGQERTIAQGTIDEFLASSDRDVRRAAFDAYADTYLRFRNTLADLLVSSARQAVFEARERGYETTRDAVLKPQDLPPATMDNVLTVFQQNLPVWHRYWRARRALLGVERLGPEDVFAPLARLGTPVPYEQAVEWIVEGLRPLGNEYVEPMRRGLVEERWVDIYPNEGKTVGAFSSGAPGTFPFILMNYTNDLTSMSTLAHELGHSMHSYLTWSTQPLQYADYGMTVAETASNFNQAMVRAYLLERHADENFQLGMMDEAFANFHRYFFIMPTLARFEQRLYGALEQGEGLNADILVQWMTELFQEGYGDEMQLEGDTAARVGITWAQFPHLYAPFYVFQYASGISAAAALAQGILNGEEGARENYLRFLRAGSSVSQLDALKIAGVDLTTPEPIERAFKVLEGLVARLENLASTRA